VGNLSFDVTDEDLRQEFQAFGEVSSVNVIKDKYSGRSRGFAFVEMPTLSEGQAAITNLNGKMLADRELRVSGATERSERGGGGGRGSYGDRRGGGGGGFSGGPRGNRRRR
jgi:RNA recognition motif-containing protein